MACGQAAALDSQSQSLQVPPRNSVTSNCVGGVVQVLMVCVSACELMPKLANEIVAAGSMVKRAYDTHVCDVLPVLPGTDSAVFDVPFLCLLWNSVQ